MNDQNTNQSGFGGSFSGGSQTNPFTADLKGEFTSNFGTNTNAVSQIFKEGGFAGERPTKLIIAGVALVVIAVGLGIYFLSGSKKQPEPLPFETDGSELAEGVAPSTATSAADAEMDFDDLSAEQTAPAETAVAPAEAPVARAMPTGSGAISLVAPNDGQSWRYDETTSGAPFEWQGGGTIIFSRSSSMQPEYMRASSASGRYLFRNPYPGTWYWQVENADGRSEVRRFQVQGAERLNLSISQPMSGGVLAGEGGVVAWQSAGKVAFYRVEFANGSFTNPNHRFATSGNSVQVSGVAPGQYQVRLGAFSETSGRWEYSSPVNVTVQ